MKKYRLVSLPRAQEFLVREECVDGQYVNWDELYIANATLADIDVLYPRGWETVITEDIDLYDFLRCGRGFDFVAVTNAATDCVIFDNLRRH